MGKLTLVGQFMDPEWSQSATSVAVVVVVINLFKNVYGFVNTRRHIAAAWCMAHGMIA